MRYKKLVLIFIGLFISSTMCASDFNTTKEEQLTLKKNQKKIEDIAESEIIYFINKDNLKMVEKLLDKYWNKRHKLSEKLQLILAKYNNEHSFKYNHMILQSNPTNEVKLELLKRTPSFLNNFKNQTEEMQIVAVKSDYKVIRDISNPSYNVQLEAINTNPEAIRYIHSPHLKISLLVNKYVRFDNVPLNMTLENKILSVKIIDKDTLLVKNMSYKFITINKLYEYYGDKTFSILNEPLVLAPKFDKNIVIKTKDRREIKTSSLEDILNFGFAVEYITTGDSQSKSLYEVNKYKVSDLL